MAGSNSCEQSECCDVVGCADAWGLFCSRTIFAIGVASGAWFGLVHRVVWSGGRVAIGFRSSFFHFDFFWFVLSCRLFIKAAIWGVWGLMNKNDSMSEVELSTEEVASEFDAGGILWDAVQQGFALKDIQGVSDGVMEGVYAYAYDFYQKGQLEEAETFFRFLCLYDMYNVDYLLGLGAVYQLRKHYQRALDTYALAAALAKNDSRPMFYAGQCNMMLRRRGKARFCFEIVAAESLDQNLKNKAQAYLEAIVSDSRGEDLK